jgi:outer membrane lipoprotein-sorting protein
MKRILIPALAVLLAVPVLAQTLSASDIISKAEATNKAFKDARFRISGNANTGNETLKLDMEVQAIPGQELVRIKFNAPDALADNFIIFDKTTISNYLFLTNQVTVTKSSKTTVNGVDFNVDQFQDISGFIQKDKVIFKPVVTETTPAGKAYVLEATPKTKDSLEFSRAKVWIIENGWRPYRYQIWNLKGEEQFNLTFVKWETNVGLTAKNLRALPKDVEVIRK